MGLGVRYLIFDEDGQFTRMPLKRFQRIADAEEAYPQAACQYLRYAEIVIEFLDRSPLAVVCTRYSKLHFDDKGFHRVADDIYLVPDLLAEWPLPVPEPEKDNVVNFLPGWAKREMERREWIPTPEEFQAIRNYFPGLL